MSRALDAGDLSEDEELMFSFEQEDACSSSFYPIGGVEMSRPVNPLAAKLDRRAARAEALASRRTASVALADAELEDKPAPTPMLFRPLPPVGGGRRKRKAGDRTAPPTTMLVRPVAKRLKSNAYERSITAPACLMGSLSLHRTRQQEDRPDELEETANGADSPTAVGPRSASISIPDSATFVPIQWPGDAAVTGGSSGDRAPGRERSHSCSSSSSAKSWTSGLGVFLRRSLDVASPLRSRISDMVLDSTVSRAGSYTGS